MLTELTSIDGRHRIRFDAALADGAVTYERRLHGRWRELLRIIRLSEALHFFVPSRRIRRTAATIFANLTEGGELTAEELGHVAQRLKLEGIDLGNTYCQAFKLLIVLRAIQSSLGR